MKAVRGIRITCADRKELRVPTAFLPHRVVRKVNRDDSHKNVYLAKVTGMYNDALSLCFWDCLTSLQGH